MLTVEGDSLIDSGFTLTLRMLGDGVNDAGLTFQMNGVRFKNITGIQMDSGDNQISKFNLACSAINYSVVSGNLTKISNFLGVARDVVSTISGMRGA